MPVGLTQKYSPWQIFSFLMSRATFDLVCVGGRFTAVSHMWSEHATQTHDQHMLQQSALLRNLWRGQVLLPDDPNTSNHHEQHKLV